MSCGLKDDILITTALGDHSMYLSRMTFLSAFAGLLSLAGCVPPVDYAALIPPPGKYDVRILRDTWGVPHIFGKTDKDVAYGLLYAHCEDDFKQIQEGLFLARAKLASIQGKAAAPVDYLVQLFRFREIVEAKYDTDLAPETRAICEASADGYNHYAALHRDQVIPGILPCTGKDVVMGFVVKTPFFFGMDDDLAKLMAPGAPGEVSQKLAATLEENNVFTHGLPIGSNTFAVGPSRTPDGSAYLDINSHQPWTGPVAWYETHLHSEEGWDMVGGVFPGTPIILHGHNRNLGWAHTVNKPDLVDVYKLDMNPDRPLEYKFDGQWRALEKRTARIKVHLWGDFYWNVAKPTYFSVYGPALETPNGFYAVRYAGYGDIRQVEQWFRMNKAKDIGEFEQALRMQAIPSFNIGYADKAGNIWYLYNALLPERSDKYNWRKYLPGNTSETLWTEYYPFETLPQVKNPASGFVQNCNSTPYRTTLGPENPREDHFPVPCGIETHMTNRALRAMELLSADDSITWDEFIAYKFDTNYSPESEAAQFRQRILDETPKDDPVVAEALRALEQWDLGTDETNPTTATAILAIEPIVRARMFGSPPPDLVATFKEKAHLLKRLFGTVTVPWGRVNRIVRGQVDLGLAGGPDTLHAVYGDWKGDHLEGMAGDCYVLMVHWSKDGTLESREIHQFGSATEDETSPHYAAQVPLFAKCATRPVWMNESEIRQHLEREYRPGDFSK